jgi:uncharacterized protein (TIGR03086 family)
MNITQAWTTAATGFGLRLQHVSAADHARPTPCDSWAVGDLIDHVFDVQNRTPAALGQPVSPEAPSPAAWRRLCEGVSNTISADALSRTVESALGPMAASDMLHIATADCLAHTWDLARALGIDDDLPSDAVEFAFEFMRPLDELLRGPGMLGPKLEPDTDATIQSQFLAFAGRNLDWKPPARR